MSRRLPVVDITAAPPDEYVPPAGDDDPLDEIEQALVRSLVRIFVRQIREEAAAAQVATPVEATTNRRAG